MNKKSLLFFFWLLNSLFAKAQTTVIDSIIHDGVWRNYRIFLPTGFNTATPLPLVFNLHGYTSNAIQQEAYSGFDSVADTAHVVMCYPNGLNNSWNVIGGTVDDVGFIDTLITLLHNQYNINLNRVYSTGLSNGGFMSNLLGCVLADRFAAIAPVAGSNVIAVQASCSPSRHMPILYIHGTADPVVNYNGDVGYSSAADLMDLWANIDGCTQITDTVPFADISPNDGCTAERITWHGCEGNNQVIHIRIIDGGHTWPGASFTIGVTNQDFIASKVIWDFFNQYTLNTGIDNIESGNRINAFPNPFYSSTEIEIPFQAKSHVNIYSPDGRLIESSQHTGSIIQLNEEGLAPGIYFLNVSYENFSETIRILKF
jgi:polyhydroxybutyrate depolymerase